MGAFRDAREVYDLIGTTLEELLRDPALTWRLREVDTSVRVDYRDPDASITVTMRRDEPVRVGYGPLAGPAEVRLTAPADVGHSFWLGELNLTIALARGDMRARGPVWKILRLAPLARAAFPRYRRRLESAGRADLLAVV
jgi:hypothetical protein